MRRKKKNSNTSLSLSLSLFPLKNRTQDYLKPNAILCTHII